MMQICGSAQAQLLYNLLLFSPLYIAGMERIVVASVFSESCFDRLRYSSLTYPGIARLARPSSTMEVGAEFAVTAKSSIAARWRVNFSGAFISSTSL